MTQITKRGRIEQYVPYKNNGTSCSISYGYKSLKGKENMGEWVIKTYNYIPTLSEIKKDILAYYNTKIDEKILTGMTWKNMQIWLSSENQFNYKAAYDLAIQTNGENLPLIFKFGTTENPIYYQFTDINELKDFYLSTLNFIQNVLLEGWKEKDNIKWEHYK